MSMLSSRGMIQKRREKNEYYQAVYHRRMQQKKTKKKVVRGEKCREWVGREIIQTVNQQLADRSCGSQSMEAVFG
jgi:hypothetical protein